MTTTMTFKVKRSTRLHPKVTLPIRLSDQSLVAVTKLLTVAGNKMAKLRNAKEKKSTRDYLFKNLPTVLHQAVLRKAVELFEGAESTINMLDLFEPGQDARERVDLLGPLRVGFGCSRAGRSKWFLTTPKESNLTAAQLEKLYNILIWSNPSELKELAISAPPDLLKASRIPNLLARGRALTRVTLLEGADNHTMRILGTSCPRLQYLDVSHSKGVSNQGLLNLLLKRPPHRQEKMWGFAFGIRVDFRIPGVRSHDYGNLSLRPKNACSETLISIKLLQTSVGLVSADYCCDYACQLISNSYMLLEFPFRRLVKVDHPEAIWERGLELDPTTGSFPNSETLSEELQMTLSNIANTIFGRLLQYLPPIVMDRVILPKQGQKSTAFIREKDRTHLRILMKIDAAAVTSMLVDVSGTAEDLTLDMIGLNLPNLKSFRGWTTGIWNRPDKPFLPNLEVASVWCFNSTTIVSMLQHAPALKLCQFNDVQWDHRNIPNERMKLTDSTLEGCLNSNPDLAASLEEIIITPCRLTRDSMRQLITRCPNLKMIGDVQSWKITSRQIKTFNRYLDKVGSQCVLSIMNHPPPRIQSFEWIW